MSFVKKAFSDGPRNGDYFGERLANDSCRVAKLEELKGLEPLKTLIKESGLKLYPSSPNNSAHYAPYTKMTHFDFSIDLEESWKGEEPTRNETTIKKLKMNPYSLVVIEGKGKRKDFLKFARSLKYLDKFQDLRFEERFKDGTSVYCAVYGPTRTTVSEFTSC